MEERPKILLAWSSGKDSAWALHTLRMRGDFEVVGLLTTLNRAFERVSMHAVREALLERQAAAVGLPLWRTYIPNPCSAEQYDAVMAETMERARASGISAVAFGDLFLEDVRRYRENRLAGTGLQPLFPLWGLDTAALSREMVAAGLRAFVTCVDPRQISAAFAGRYYDERFLDELPRSADPCGERGEFHSFAFDGPMFSHRVPFVPGEVVEREGFVFADAR